MVDVLVQSSSTCFLGRYVVCLPLQVEDLQRFSVLGRGCLPGALLLVLWFLLLRTCCYGRPVTGLLSRICFHGPAVADLLLRTSCYGPDVTGIFLWTCYYGPAVTDLLLRTHCHGLAVTDLLLRTSCYGLAVTDIFTQRLSLLRTSSHSVSRRCPAA